MRDQQPLDGDATAAADASGDTAFKVANGVARVARAGAYVTGGALIASNSDTPAQPGQRLDSWHTGWSGPDDPSPDVPSPVVTFPDPEPEYVPYAPQRTTLVAQEAPPSGTGEAPPMDYRLSPAPDDILTARGGTGDDDPTFLDAAPSFLDAAPADDAVLLPSSPHDPGAPGYWGEGATPGTSPAFELPDAADFLTNPTADLFGLGKHPALTKPGAGEHGEGREDGADSAFDPADGMRNTLLDANRDGFGDWSDNPGLDGQWGDLGAGAGDFGVYVGVEAHASLYTELEVDFGIGPDGFYLSTEMKIEASAGFGIETAAGTNIGDQLDNLSTWLNSKAPATAGRTGTEQSALGTGSGTPGLGGSAPGLPAAVTPVAPVAAPVAPTAPAHFAAPPAPAPAPAVVAPVAPAPAPMVAVPVAAAPVVAATPLQTTIQPEAANSPIANVLAPPQGPSPLTVPAAEIPIIFDRQPVKPNPATPTVPVPTDTVDTGTRPLPTTSLPTPSTGIELPSTVQITPDPSTDGLPGSIVTRTPVTAPDTGTDTGSEITTTKVPGATTTRPAPAPTTGDDDTTPGTGGDSPGTGTGRPTTELPSAESPTVSVPSPETTAPTYQPTRPTTVDAPTTLDVPSVQVPTADVPTVDVPSVDVDVPTYSAPAPAPVTPVKPLVGPNGRPISEQWDPSHAPVVHSASASLISDTDHGTVASLAGGLSTGLLDGGLAGGGLYDHGAAHGTLDHTVI